MENIGSVENKDTVFKSICTIRVFMLTTSYFLYLMMKLSSSLYASCVCGEYMSCPLCFSSRIGILINNMNNMNSRLELLLSTNGLTIFGIVEPGAAAARAAEGRRRTGSPGGRRGGGMRKCDGKCVARSPETQFR